jgi:hypothetical protein
LTAAASGVAILKARKRKARKRFVKSTRFARADKYRGASSLFGACASNKKSLYIASIGLRPNDLASARFASD